MRIAVADDGALFRDGLVLLLRNAGHDVLHCTDDGDALVDLIEERPVDMAVLDIRMPPEPEGGLVAAGRLRKSHPEIGLLLLSHYAETHYLARVLAIGPERIGYRLKDKLSSVDALNDTLTRVAGGEIVIEPSLTGRLVEQARKRRDHLTGLSVQDLRVLALMASGMSNQGIATELDLSRRTVEKQVGGVFAKLALPDDGLVHNRRVLAVLTYLQIPGPGR